jgi:mannitol/fructose-specific phosphotransferase system IIA component (Ntr-type)
VFEGVARQFGLPVVVVPRSAQTQEQVVHFLIAALAAGGGLAAGSEDKAVADVLKRESLAPTGLGRGAALPHGLTTAVSAPTGAVGRVPHGVVWGGADEQPVTAVCLVLCPASCGRLREYMQMLEGAARELAASTRA